MSEAPKWPQHTDIIAGKSYTGGRVDFKNLMLMNLGPLQPVGELVDASDPSICGTPDPLTGQCWSLDPCFVDPDTHECQPKCPPGKICAMIPVCPMTGDTLTCGENNRDGSGACDPLECPRSLVCPAPQVLNRSTCQCECREAPSCGSVKVPDPATCCCRCPDGQVQDPATCECSCPFVTCPGGKTQDPASCACACEDGCPTGRRRARTRAPASARRRRRPAPTGAWEPTGCVCGFLTSDCKNLCPSGAPAQPPDCTCR